MVDFPDLNPFGNSGLPDLGGGATTKNEKILEQQKNLKNQSQFTLPSLTVGSKLEEPDENEVGLIESAFAGIASGAIKIPEGVISLGAQLIDLGADTNTAAKVENFFDGINIFEDTAQERASGKITEALVNIGIPGGFAFTKGASLASNAIKAKKAKKYLNLKDKKSLSEFVGPLQKQAVTLSKKDKLKTYAVGTLGSGVAEGAFVADVDKIGTFGDLVGGPTELERGSDEDITRDLVNRVKFGTEGALFTGLIGGVGATIKAIAKRNRSTEAVDTKIDKLLDFIGGGFRAKGYKTKEFFDEERKMIGQRAADVRKAQTIARDTNKIIDGLFPFFKGTFNQTTIGQKKVLNKKINDALLSGKPVLKEIKDLDGKQKFEVSFGDMSKKEVDIAKEALKNTGAKPEDILNIFAGLQSIRGQWGELFSNMGYMLKGENKKQFATFQKNFADKFQEYLGGTYDIFVNKPLLPFTSYKPPRQAVENAITMMMKAGTATREQAEKYVSDILDSVNLPKGATFTDMRNPDPVFRAPQGLLKGTIAEELTNKGFISARFLDNKKKIVVGKTKDGKDITKTQRQIVDELLGKLENPTQTILAGTERLSGITRVNQLYRQLETISDQAIKSGRPGMFFKPDNFGGDKAAAREAANRVFGRDNVEELFIDPNRVFEIGSGNPLQGAFTSKGIQEALETGEKNLISNPALSFVYDSFVLYPKATSQIAKTILSPITHVRNFVSAGAFAAANGLIPGLTVSPIAMAKAMKESYGTLQAGFKGMRKQNERYDELLKLGVVNSNVRLGDLRRLLGDLDFGETLTNAKGLGLITRKFKTAGRVLQDLYTAEDDFWKITTFALERRRTAKSLEKLGLTKGKNFTDSTGKVFKYDDKYLDEVAANIVRNNVPNYDYVGRFVQNLRKFPVGNFVSFPAEIIRTGSNIVESALKEINYTITIDTAQGIKKVKPFRNTGLARLFGFGTTVATVPYMTVEALKAAYNVTEEEMQALRRYVPDWSKNSTLVPVRDEKTGKLKYIDFSHGNAYDTLTRPIQTIINAVAEGREDDDGILDDFLIGVFRSTKELGEPFISESIWTEAAADIIVRRGRTADGREIFNPEDRVGAKASKIIGHLVESQTPGSIAAFERLDLAFEPVDIIKKGKVDQYGKSYEIGDEALGILGFRAVEVDPLKSIGFKIKDYQDGLRNSKKLFTSELLRGGPITTGDIVDRFILANQAAYKVSQNFYKDYTAAIRLGADVDSLNEDVIGRLGRKQLNKFENGEFEPLSISAGIKESFAKQAADRGDFDPYEIVESYLDEIRDFYRDIPIGLETLPSFPNPFKEIELSPTDTSYLPSSGPPIGPASNITNVDPQTGLTATELALLSPNDQAIRQKLNRRV